MNRTKTARRDIRRRLLILAASVTCLVATGCRSVNSKFPSPFAKAADADATEEDSGLLGKRGVVKNDRSFLQGISNPVSRLGPLTKSSGSETGNAQALAPGHELFQKAMEADGPARQALFADAASAYAKVTGRLKKSPFHEDALFWLGESSFFADKYPKALEAFGELAKKYPNSRHLDNVSKRRFAVAQYWLGLKETDGFDLYPNLTNRRRPAVDTFGHAIRTLDRIRFDDPTGKLADDATMASAIANYRQERWDQANILFDDLRQNFPNSEHQAQAHLLQLECKRKIYEGPDYDGSVLDEAEKLIKQIVLQFPDESRDRREYLEKTAGDIRLKKAQRDFTLAQYYDRRKEFGAARLSYSTVAREYPDTNLGKEAEARLTELGGKASAPTERLQWLADIFPEEKEPKPLIASDKIRKIFR